MKILNGKYGEMNNVFSKYKNKKVLITGHTGFKGSWLTIWLHELGADITGVALDPFTEKDNFVLSGLSDKINDLRCDILKYDKLLNVFQKIQPEFVFHLAAQPLVRYSYEHPKLTFDTNIGGTVNVLECCRLTDSVSSIVVVTSDKCYENREWIWGYRENDALGGYDPYSASKGGAEIVVNAYLRSFFNPADYKIHGKSLASVRAGNVIGGGDWSVDRIIPDCIRSLENNKKITIRNPNAVRPWQHVLEPLSGYLKLALKIIDDPLTFCGAWNFGPYSSSIVPVKEIADLVISNYGKGEWHIDDNQKHPHEASLLALDISKAVHILGWNPSLNIDQTIELTIDWYKKYSTDSVYSICQKQIEFFISHSK